jgi:hypothetical protein
MQKSKARRINIRVANEEDDGKMITTTIDPCTDEIILARQQIDENGESEKESDKELEEEFEEVLNHEILHILIKRAKNYFVCCCLDDISGWTKEASTLKPKIVFLSKKQRRKLKKLVEEKKEPILKGVIEQLPD